MGLDIFFGSEDSEGGMSPDKLREYKARMARNKQMMAAAKQQEQRQKKKEDRLAAILLKFLQTNKRMDLTLLISRCLEQNIPAVFVLSIVLLTEEEIQDEIGVRFDLGVDPILMDGPSGESSAFTPASLQAFHDMEEPEVKQSLVAFGQDHTFPLKMRVTLDLWTKMIFDTVSPMPERILKTSVQFNEDPEAVLQPKDVLVQLSAFVLRDYFVSHDFEQPYENVHSFGEFLLRGILKRLKDQVADQKLIS